MTSQESDQQGQDGPHNEADNNPDTDARHATHSDDQEAEQTVDASEAEAAELDDAAASKISELQDQVLRGLAEMENVKRRASRDVENAHKYAVEKLVDSLLPVIDSLEKAVETAEEAAGEDGGTQAIAEGVSLSLKLFLDTLAKNGVEQIDPLGQPFDPNLHEALTMVPNPDAEPNSVMDVMARDTC